MTAALACRAPALQHLTAEDVLERLQGVRRNGERRWMARCPAHGDKGPSLSVREGEAGRVLLHCFSGCDFNEVVDALGLQPQQLFPPSDRPWTPRPRRDPERENREAFEALRMRHRIPPPARIRDEMRLVGALILGGSKAFADLPDGFDSSCLQTVPLRLMCAAIEELVRQGTPRRWFSPLAMCREFDHAEGPGSGERRQVFFWARMAIHEAAR